MNASPSVSNPHEQCSPGISIEQFARAYEQYFGRTVRLLRTLGVPGDLPEEFAQHAWAKAWARRAELRDPLKLMHWVIAIALNAFRSQCRAHWREEQLIPGHDRPEPAQQATAHLAAEVLKLSGPHRKLLENVYILGYSVQQVAEMELSRCGTVRQHLFRARRYARKKSSGS